MLNKKNLALILVLLISTTAFSGRIRQEKNLSSLLRGHKTLKVFLGSFMNQSGSPQAGEELFKKILKDFLSQRKSAKFIVVDNPVEATITIETKILSYRYLEHDPIDQFNAGTAGLIADTLISQNYVQIKASYLVMDSKGRPIWSNEFTSSVTRSNMPPQDAVPRVFLEASKRLVFKCFGPPSGYR